MGSELGRKNSRLYGMYLATKDQKYLTTSESFYTPGAAWGQSWDEKIAGAMVCILLQKIRNISLLQSLSTHQALHGVRAGTKK